MCNTAVSGSNGQRSTAKDGSCAGRFEDEIEEVASIPSFFLDALRNHAVLSFTCASMTSCTSRSTRSTSSGGRQEAGL